MRLPFFRDKKTATPERPRAPKAGDDGATVEAARTRARRRLVGALVLLVIGVVGFPILFETQPRPLPLDTPMQALRPETAAAEPRLSPSSPSSPSPSTTRRPPPVLPVLPGDAGTEMAMAASSPAVPAAASATTAAPVPVPAASSAAPLAPKPRASAPVAATPAAANAQAPAAVAPAASTAGRFVVQVGAYTDAATLREARARVEKLGLKTYTQVVGSETGQRTRVRLGPFATRDEADAAAAKLKRAGLPANILAL